MAKCKRCGQEGTDKHIAYTALSKVQLCEYCHDHLWVNGRLQINCLHKKDGTKEYTFKELSPQLTG